MGGKIKAPKDLTDTVNSSGFRGSKCFVIFSNALAELN